MTPERFTPIEKNAGFFFFRSFCFLVFFFVGFFFFKVWFEPRSVFYFEVVSVEGLHEGTEVWIAGLKVGAVEQTLFGSNGKVQVHFWVLDRYSDQIHTDSQISILRPLIIGDRVLEISAGSSSQLLKSASLIPSSSSYDMLEFLSGRKISPFLTTIEGMSSNFKLLAQSLLDPKRTRGYLKALDALNPLISDMGQMARQTAQALRPVNEN